jgi:hypothetical protein
MTDGGPRWSGWIVPAVSAVGFLSAVVVMLKLLGRKVVNWLREKGGW